jgi:hypothetical protein
MEEEDDDDDDSVLFVKIEEDGSGLWRVIVSAVNFELFSGWLLAGVCHHQFESCITVTNHKIFFVDKRYSDASDLRPPSESSEFGG